MSDRSYMCIAALQTGPHPWDTSVRLVIWPSYTSAAWNGTCNPPGGGEDWSTSQG